MTVNQRIRERRKELGLSVDEIVRKLGVNRATYYRYESNEIERLPLSVIEALAGILQTTPAHLMGWDQVKVSEIEAPAETKEEYPRAAIIQASTPGMDRKRILTTDVIRRSPDQEAQQLNRLAAYQKLIIATQNVKPENYEKAIKLLQVLSE